MLPVASSSHNSTGAGIYSVTSCTIKESFAILAILGDKFRKRLADDTVSGVLLTVFVVRAEGKSVIPRRLCSRNSVSMALSAMQERSGNSVESVTIQVGRAGKDV